MSKTPSKLTESKRSLSRGSSGAVEAETPPSETSTDAATTAPQPPTSAESVTPSDSENNAAEVNTKPPAELPGVQELKARMEAKVAVEPERPPHPYKWRIERESMIPFGFRDPATGQPSNERIEAHVADCWRVGTAPSIEGVLVTLPASNS